MLRPAPDTWQHHVRISKINWLLTTVHTHTPHPSRQQALGRKLRECLVPGDRGRQKHFQEIQSLKFGGAPGLRWGWGTAQRVATTMPSGPKPGSLFTPGCFSRDQAPDAQVWVLTSPPPRHPQPRSSGLPARPREAPAWSGRRRGGISWRGRG